ncbi:MAG TPA: PAS domain-containing protein [Coleofasciculaceae cyanobacterium]
MNTSKPQLKVMEQPASADVALSTFLALSLDLFCIRGQDGYFQQLNPAWENLLGWSESELRQKPWIEFVHPDDVAATLKAFRRCILGNTVEYTNRYRHKDGSYRWLFWRVLQRQDGLFYGVAKDIKPLTKEHRQVELLTPEERGLNERKRVEQELKPAIAELTEWQNRYKAVGQITGQLLYEWNSETDELIWGENVEQVLGYSPDELKNRMTQWGKLVHPDDWETNWQAIARCKVTKEPIALEYRILKKDGAYITVAHKGKFYPDREGNLKCMVGFIVDISNTYRQTRLRRKAESALQQALNDLEARVEERTTQLQQINEQLQAEIAQHQKTEAALQQSEELLRAIVEDQTELICRFKPEGTLTFVNNAYCRYFNKERSELIGKNFIPIISEEDQEFVTQCFNCLSQEKPIITYEHRVFLPSGEMRWQQWTDRALFNEQGNLMEFQAVGRDITPLKQAETEIRKALDKERELSELRSGFVSLVSHEFRNPLTTIQSSVDLLQRYNQKLSEEQKLNHFTRIHSAVDRMTQLLDDVLMIGKAEAGKLSFEPATLDLENLCYTIVETIQMSASPHHEIDVVIQGDFKTVQIDEKLLGHIVNNLLSNAIKYSPEGGTVRFELTDQDKSAIFRIQDNGIGIPADYLEQMFETFQRAKNVGSIPGTGLGLAIVKKCVDLHGGTIAVDSKIGTGTIFTVTLPLNRSEI